MGNTASRRFLKEKPVFVTGSTSGIWDVSWQLNDYLKLENKLVYGRYHNERLHLPMTVSPQGVPAELKGRELQWEPVLHFYQQRPSERPCRTALLPQQTRRMGGHPQHRRSQHL